MPRLDVRFQRAWAHLVDLHGPKQAARVMAQVLKATVAEGEDVVATRLERALLWGEAEGRRASIDLGTLPADDRGDEAEQHLVPVPQHDAERRREFRQLVEDSSIGPDALRAELTTSPVRCYDRTCRHHHAEGDPFDRSLITGPPCEGCRWCQAIAVRSK